jgi:hypothetical protein
VRWTNNLGHKLTHHANWSLLLKKIWKDTRYLINSVFVYLSKHVKHKLNLI